MDVVEKAEKNLERQLSWVEKFDVRATFIAGIALAMLGASAGILGSISQLTIPIIVFGSLNFALLGASLVCIYASQFPNTESPNLSLIYFSTIADLKSSTFAENFKKMSNDDYVADLLYQTHRNATIVRNKFSALKQALIALLLSAIPWTIVVLASKVSVP